jgi:two-component system sensor histidine kinase/response regulator
MKTGAAFNYILSDYDFNILYKGIYAKADRLTEGSLALMFVFGISIAFFYDTWLIAFGVGALCLFAYFITKKLLPESNLYQFVLSGVYAVFAAQYIYQMHGMAEMHFWVFICSTILIIYQNWRLQIPLIVLVVIHHGTFAYLQYIGYKEIYFTRLNYMDLTTFLFHGALASCVCVVSGIWSYNIRKRTVQDALNLKTLLALKTELQQSADNANQLNEELTEVNKEIQAKNEELRTSEEELLASGEELKQINENLNALVEHRTQTIINQNKRIIHHAFINAHKVRSPLARILGLVNLIGHEAELNKNGQELLKHLNQSAAELDDILKEVRVNLDQAEFKGLGEDDD